MVVEAPVASGRVVARGQHRKHRPSFPRGQHILAISNRRVAVLLPPKRCTIRLAVLNRYAVGRGEYAGEQQAEKQPTLQPQEPGSAAAEPDAVYLSRSQLMDKEVITRTSGKRLGYINQLYMDPARLEVVSVYMRPSSSPLPLPGSGSAASSSSEDHVLLSSLRQVWLGVKDALGLGNVNLGAGDISHHSTPAPGLPPIWFRSAMWCWSMMSALCWTHPPTSTTATAAWLALLWRQRRGWCWGR
jgi:hypothetical protein